MQAGMIVATGGSKGVFPLVGWIPGAKRADINRQRNALTSFGVAEEIEGRPEGHPDG